MSSSPFYLILDIVLLYLLHSGVKQTSPFHLRLLLQTFIHCLFVLPRFFLNTTMSVSLYTLLQRLRHSLDQSRELLEPTPDKKESFIFTVWNEDEPGLPSLTIEFLCNPGHPSTSLHGRGSKTLLGFSGWHWSEENEVKFTIRCIGGCGPLRALDDLIAVVKSPTMAC